MGARPFATDINARYNLYVDFRVELNYKYKTAKLTMCKTHS
jgi:hypothetical protein